MYLFYFSIFIFGLCIGSFLNVVILRLRSGEKITGRSHCPKCGHVLKWYENLPLLSFIILRGRCSKCQQKISWQYPLVELTTGLLFLLSFLYSSPPYTFSTSLTPSFSFSPSNLLTLLFYWTVISFLLIIFVYDLKYYLIPDKISIPAIIVVLIFQILLFFLPKNPNIPKLLNPFLLSSFPLLFLSAIIISGFFWCQYVLSGGRWVGGGDIRLGFLMGVILAWPLGLVALFLAYILGLLVTLPLLILKRKRLKSQVPFGVFLTTATVITMFWGEKILAWYLSFL